MRKTKSYFCLVCLIVLAGCILSTPLFSADNLPADKKEKILKLEPYLTISDKEKDFYFRYPEQVYGDSSNGNIYVVDSRRVLMFNDSGNFKKNLVTRGQGPGEVSGISALFITDKNVIVQNFYPGKLIKIDKNGLFQGEFRIYEKGIAKLAAVYKDTYYLFSSSMPHSTKGSRYMDIGKNLFAVDAKGKLIEILHTFPVKEYYVVNASSQGLFSIGELLYRAFKGRYLFISHTPEYGIKFFDLEEKKIIKEISKQYNRQEIPKELVERFHRSRIELEGKLFKKPRQKYFNDIQNLLTYKENLWVITSTVDKKKGLLIDVFTFDGAYSDSFYLKMPERVDLYKFNGEIFGDFLYTIEYDEAGDPAIVKYKIAF